jgi:hypothetical protein
MKGLMALGDWQLLRARAYDSSYRVRQSRFAWLAPGLQLDPRQCALIDAAYQYKIHPAEVPLDISARIPCVISWLTDAAVTAVACVTQQEIATPVDASRRYYHLTTQDAAAVAEDNAFVTQTFAAHARIRVRQPTAASVRQSIYAAIPLVAAGSIGDCEAFAAAVTQLNGCLSPACSEQLTDSNWQLVNNQVADAWLTMVH